MPEGSQSSSPSSRKGKSIASPGGVEQVDAVVGLAPAHRRRECQVELEEVFRQGRDGRIDPDERGRRRVRGGFQGQRGDDRRGIGRAIAGPRQLRGVEDGLIRQSPLEREPRPEADQAVLDAIGAEHRPAIGCGPRAGADGDAKEGVPSRRAEFGRAHAIQGRPVEAGDFDEVAIAGHLPADLGAIRPRTRDEGSQHDQQESGTAPPTLSRRERVPEGRVRGFVF